MAEPLGPHHLVAATVLDRFDDGSRRPRRGLSIPPMCDTTRIGASISQ